MKTHELYTLLDTVAELVVLEGEAQERINTLLKEAEYVSEVKNHLNHITEIQKDIVASANHIVALYDFYYRT